ncbi:MAG: P-type conjugative transfer protein TrbL [Candidatus Binataceae bacterium]|jgi:type IV secretion system protein TrbL|nr:P-type conjugative transfer protein TrbL [Candidatus Binataceae bacterium]
MSNFNLDNITAQFYTAAVHYSAVIQPYALKLFFALFLIDIIVTWIQYTAEGQLDPSFFLGRMLKHVLSGGFVYLMIVNGFSWMYLVIQSFSRIGSAISGLSALSPQSVIQAGLNMANTLLSSPTTSGVVSSLELALVEGFCALVVAAAFLIVAVELLLTLVKAYLTTSLGVILLGFGGNRFTASASEGYFTNVIRIGVKVLFFYAVLALGMQMVAQWEAALAAACKPVTTAVPMVMSYYVPPSKIMTTVCSGTLATSDMLIYAALATVFAVVTVAVPSMAAELVGGTVGLALAHAFEAAYTAQTIARIVNPITAGLKKVSEGVASLGGGKGNAANGEQTAIQSILRDHQRRTSAEAAASAATTVLNPFTGKPRPFNGGSSPSPSGPALPPPSNGPGGGGAAQLGYEPGRPGQYTKDIAVDVTELQNRNDKDS